MKRQFLPFPLPRTLAIEMSTRATFAGGWIRFALLQPRSRETPRSSARRRDRRSFLRLIRVTGASLSGQLPRAAFADAWTLLAEHSDEPPVWLDTQVPGSLSGARCWAS